MRERSCLARLFCSYSEFLILRLAHLSQERRPCKGQQWSPVSDQPQPVSPGRTRLYKWSTRPTSSHSFSSHGFSYLLVNHREEEG